MKKTAIEFLISKIESNSNPSLTQKELKESIEQAKEMERKQIIDAYKQGQFEFDGDMIRESHAEQYYNETFKKQTMKQTAIEFLISKIESNSNPSLTQEELKESIQQAKEMEKQQIIDAYNEADTFPQSYHNAENYYNETFKK